MCRNNLARLSLFLWLANNCRNKKSEMFRFCFLEIIIYRVLNAAETAKKLRWCTYSRRSKYIFVARHELWWGSVRFGCVLFDIESCVSYTMRIHSFIMGCAWSEVRLAWRNWFIFGHWTATAIGHFISHRRRNRYVTACRRMIQLSHGEKLFNNIFNIFDFHATATL